MGVAAGQYDPVRATIFKPNRTLTAAGEPVATAQDPIVICRRFIRLKTVGANETFDQLKSQSSSILQIWMHKDSKTETINTDCWIVHRGLKYGIQGILRQDYINDEVGFKVQCNKLS